MSLSQCFVRDDKITTTYYSEQKPEESYIKYYFIAYTYLKIRKLFTFPNLQLVLLCRVQYFSFAAIVCKQCPTLSSNGFAY